MFLGNIGQWQEIDAVFEESRNLVASSLAINAAGFHFLEMDFARLFGKAIANIIGFGRYLVPILTQHLAKLLGVGMGGRKGNTLIVGACHGGGHRRLFDMGFTADGTIDDAAGLLFVIGGSAFEPSVVAMPVRTLECVLDHVLVVSCPAPEPRLCPSI